MWKVIIDENNDNGFFNTNRKQPIPDNALDITDSDYETFFRENGKYVFVNVNGQAVLQTRNNTLDAETQKWRINLKYKAIFEELGTAYNAALLNGNAKTQELIKQNYATEKQNYTTELQEVK